MSVERIDEVIFFTGDVIQSIFQLVVPVKQCLKSRNMSRLHLHKLIWLWTVLIIFVALIRILSEHTLLITSVWFMRIINRL
jgi:hypothetical protein